VYGHITIVIEPAVISSRPQNVGAGLIKSHFDLIEAIFGDLRR